MSQSNIWKHRARTSIGFEPMRQDDLRNIEKAPFLMWNFHPNEYNKRVANALNTRVDDNLLLEKLFFSPQNVDNIQKALIMRVYHETDRRFLIPKQNYQSVVIPMRYIYNEYARHLPFNFKEQVRDLNIKVVDTILPDVIRHCEQYAGYIDDITEPRIRTIDRPLNVSRNRSLPSVTTRFFS